MSSYGPYPGVIRSWHDGDTCHVDLDLGFGIQLTTPLSCRVFGINAAELSTATGKDALAAALRVCPVGTPVRVLSHGWDKYGGRFDGEITLPDGSDFGTQMIAAGYAVAYKG